MEKPAAHFVTPDDLINPDIEVAIHRDSVNDLPLRSYEGNIVLVSDDAGVAPAIDDLKRETVLGFDTESRPVFRRGDSSPISLLQLAGAETVWLFQMQRIENLEPIFSILSEPAILKVGVAIRDDVRKLKELQDFTSAGFIEISEHTQKAGIVNTGLRNLAALFLQFRVSKGAQVSNWARKELSLAQVRYAATDAWVSRELYLKVHDLKLVSEKSNGRDPS